MAHGEPSRVPSSATVPPICRASDASSLQTSINQATNSPTLSTSGSPSDTPNFQNGSFLPSFAPNSPTLRKTSCNSILVPLPNPLRIFKRQDQKASLDAVLRHPSLQSLKAQLSLSAVAKLPVTVVQTPYDLLDCHVAHRDRKLGGDDSTVLLPSHSSSEDESHITKMRHKISAKKRSARPDANGEEAYDTDFQHEIDLKHPTQVRRRVSSSPAVATKGSVPVNSSCALCKTELKGTLKTYAFPQTTPAVIAAVRTLHPTLDSNLNLFSSDWNGTSTAKEAGNLTSQAKSPPTFCVTCFEELHTLRLCWTCGLTIDREEERVNCGWAWWHWGCMSCLLCRAPIRPPAWTAAPITLSDSPACNACLRELRELVFLERKKMNLCRRRLSPASTPDFRLGTRLGRSLDGSRIVGRPDSSRRPPRRKPRQVSGSGTIVVKRSRPTLQGNTNNRMNWMLRKGEGLIGGGSVNRSGSTKLGWVGCGYGYGYPPLPKWMEKLPGRRSASGMKKKVEAEMC